MRAAAFKKLLRLTFYFLPFILFIANVAGSRADVAPASSARGDSLPVRVTIYENHRTGLASLAVAQVALFHSRRNRPTAQEVRAYVRAQATEYGVSPFLALWIVKHESHFNPLAKGDGEASRGLWQISRIYHPEVSDEAAFDVASSTEWSLAQIRAGKANEWSTYRRCRSLYKDCPF